MTILLIVENDTQLRSKIAAILTAAFPSVHIFQAANAMDAARIVEEKQPRIAIVDIKLPGTSGLDLTRDIKHTCSMTTVIVNSNYDSPEYRQAAAQHGADHFLSKKSNPINDLIQLIETIVSSRQPSRLINVGTPASRSEKLS